MGMIAHEQLGKLTDRIDKLRSYLDIDKKKILIQNEEEKSSQPRFLEQPQRGRIGDEKPARTQEVGQ